MARSRYTLVISRDEEDASQYNVAVKELPGCYTHGTSLEQCIARAWEAIQGFLESQARKEAVISAVVGLILAIVLFLWLLWRCAG